MDAYTTRYCLSLLLLTSIATSGGSNETSKDEPREPRVSGRIVKLYSGAKPEPFICTGEGFQADYNNCAVFYRCVKERSGKFTVFRYQCAPGTVYDPDLETCNHPRSTRRSECGGMLKPTAQPSIPAQINEIDGSQPEVPRPISTKVPIYTEQTTFKNPTTLSWMLSTERQSNHTQMPGAFTTHKTSSTLIGEQDKTTKFSSFSTGYPWSASFETEYTTRRISPSIIAQQSNLKNNDPCTSDGFMGDSENCRKFYRCVANQRGGYIKYEFSCSELTVWDDDIQGCNHPWAVKRSKCGRSMSYVEKSEADTSPTESSSSSTAKDSNMNNGGYGYKSNKTVQHQLQVSHGHQVTQTQTQISNSNDVIQNQTQIHYGEKLQNNQKSKSESKQNQTQISFGTAVSQTQTQIDYGKNGVQTQLQIDHSKDSSQSQIQIHDTTTIKSATKPQSNNGYNECSESGFKGDANDCKKFYRCVDNGKGTYTKFDYICGDGTLWDPEIEACNHAWAVKNCGGTRRPDTASDGYTTSINSTEVTKTTESYHTTTQILDTDDKDDVGYGNQNHQDILSSSTSTSKPTTTSVISMTTTTEQPNEVNTECKSSGFVGDANNCKLFYRCVDNGRGSYIKHEFKCGDGTLWDPDIEACNHAWAVKKCGGSSPGNENKEETTTQKGNTTPSQHEQTTVTLTQITSQAPTQTDDYDAGYVSHGHEPSTTTVRTTKQPQEQGDTSSECKSSGFIGDQKDCKKFYRCVDNGRGSYTRYEFICGEGTVWDPEIEACNHAWAVEKCGGQSEPTHTTQQTTSEHAIMQDEEQESEYVNPSYETSEHPQMTTTFSSSSTTSTTLSETGKCNNSGFMGDKINCKKFYRCVDNGKGGYDRYEFNCGEGTVWDSTIEACNHVWAVKDKCGTSESSSPQAQNESITQAISSASSDGQTQQSTENPTMTTEHQHGNEVLSDECAQEGFFGSQKDCKKFYRCVDNGKGGFTKYDFTCGEGTSWNSDIQGCDHANPNKPCSTKPSQEPIYLNDDMDTPTSTTNKATTSLGEMESTKTTKKPEASEGTCESDGFYGNPSDCRMFYRCVDNSHGGFTKYDFTCGQGTVWNQDIQACDHESADKTCISSSANTESTAKQSESTTSSYSTTKKEQTTDKTESSQNTESDCTSEGFFAHPNDCKKFVRCVSNDKGGYTRYEFSCGDGTVWVQVIQACDYDNGVTSCNTQNESTFKPQHTEEQSSNTSVSSVISSTESMTPSREDDEYDSETPKEPFQGACLSEGYFAVKDDCRKFYRCVDNGHGKYTKFDFVCGDGTAWDQDLQTCNHIKEVQSCNGNNQHGSDNHHTTTNKNQAQTESTSSTTKDTTSSESFGSSTNSQDTCESEGFYGNSKDCKKFYRCVDNGKGGYTKYDFTCGEGTIWDQDITTCNHPQDVSNPSCDSSQESGDSLSTTSTTTSSSSQVTSAITESSSSSSQNTSDCSQESYKKPANNNVTCDKAGYYENPNDCKKFYRCVDWDGDGKRFSVFHFECGEGTIWDPALDTCNHEDSVYPKRDCNQSQNMGQSTCTDGMTSTTTTELTTSEETTQESTTSQQTTTQESTTSEQTTTQQSTTSEQTTTQQSTTDKTTTTQESTTSEQTTTQQTTTSVKTTTEKPATSEQTTSQQTTTSEKTTTQEPTTTAQTTTQQSTTSEQTTTQEQTTIEQTTAQQTTTEQTTTSEQTTTQQSTTNVETTTQESPTSEQTTTQQSTTSEQTTTQESTTSEQTTTQQSSTSEQTTTQESTTEQSTTQESTTSEQTTPQTATSEQSTTQESTTSEQTTPQTTTSEQTTTQESTTSEQTTTSDQTTTEQSNEQTTEEPAATEPNTEGTTTTEESTDQTTTQTSSTESDSTESTEPSANTSSSGKECPETDDDQYVLVCPTSFKRHPKYCNMFYQCTEEDDTYEAKVAMFKCPNGTIYDENKIQCVTENKADKQCEGEIANKRRFKRLGSHYKDPIIADQGKLSCSTDGYFSFEKGSECSKGFLKCEKNINGVLKGHVYQCPDGYIYWAISKRCEHVESVRDCKKSSNDWTGRWNIPVERKNVAVS